jgi:hypothetical protein
LPRIRMLNPHGYGEAVSTVATVWVRAALKSHTVTL